MATPFTLAPATGIGHVHLKVTDLERSIAFYRDVMGFEVTQRYGIQAAFLSAGGYHHHIGLNTWHSQGLAQRRSAQPASTTPPYSFPRGSICRASCGIWWKWASPWTVRLTMGYRMRCTCAIRIKMAWKCIGICHRRSGRGMPMANSKWERSTWTWRPSWI